MNRLFRLLAALAVIVACSSSSEKDAELRAHADAIHKECITLDSHTDSAMYLVRKDKDHSKLQVNFDKMQQGGMDVVFFAVYVGQGPRDAATLKAKEKFATDVIFKFKRYVDEHADQAAIAYNTRDIRKYKAEGKAIGVLAIENGYVVGKDITNIEKFYNMGVRCMTLSHNYNNDICDASRDSVAEWHGLSPFGEKVIAEMNRVGMIVDVSHASTETLYDCIRLSKAPIVCTHSCVWNIKDHPRNLTDDEIRAIADKGGVIQVTTGRWALSWQPREKVNIGSFCDHADYIKNLVGAEHVGIGTDFDGGGGMNQLEDVTCVKGITMELIRRGWSDRELKLFWGENFLRVMDEVQRIAYAIQDGEKDVENYEDD